MVMNIGSNSDFEYILAFDAQDKSVRTSSGVLLSESSGGNNDDLAISYTVNGTPDAQVDFTQTTLIDFTARTNSGNLTLSNSIVEGGGSGRVFKGIFKECIIYNGPLNTGQIQKVEGYLAWKWGIEGNLPVGHPYKNAAP